MPDFNILSPKDNKAVNLSEYDFWIYYIQLVETQRPSLNNFDIRCLVSMLTFDDLKAIPKDKALINHIGATMRIKPTNKNTFPSVYRSYTNLIATGYLKNIDGEYYINDSLNNFRKYVKRNINSEGFDISFIFKFKIIKDGNLG